MKSVGIIGLGTYLPPTVRTNDWWSPTIVSQWRDRDAARATRPDAPAPATLTSGLRRTLAAMGDYASDPFRGAVERRIMPEDMTTSEMEAHAAREAIKRAGIRTDQIDVVLAQTPAPENLVVNYACITHRLLELSPRCLALSTEVGCNAFTMHLTLAQAMIASGQARYVLSVHSAAMNRLMRPEEPDSAWWGDGAAAVVLGPVSDGKGIIAARHNTDGSTCDALVLGIPGRRWWQVGETTLFHLDRAHTRSMLLNLVDRGGGAIRDVMADAGVTAMDVDFYASHQGTAWFTTATAAEAGLEHAKTIVTFPYLGNMSSANIPTILAMAEREGTIRDGSVVVAFSGGVGETWSSLCLRWGR